jgi:hypothetical protein
MLRCPFGHPIDLEDPLTVRTIKFKDEDDEEDTMYSCGKCRVVFTIEEEDFGR